jgi:hypothetical protein
MPSLAEGDEDTKQMIATMAQMKDGVATIQVRNKETGITSEKKVEELTPDDIKNLQKANEESSKSIEDLAINQLDQTKQINAYLQSGKVSGALAKATAPSIEKLGYFVADNSKSLAENYKKGLGTVSSMREGVQSVAGPIEDYTYGFTTGNKEVMNQAITDFGTNFSTLADNFFDGAKTYVKNVSDNGIESLKTTFGREQQSKTEVTHKHEGTLTLKGEGTVNGSTSRDINDLFSDPSNVSQANFLLNGGSAPSASTGKKN